MTHKSRSLHSIDNYEETTRSYDTRYIAEIRHTGLGTYRLIKDLDSDVLDNKVKAQFRKWDDQWARITQKSKSQADKEQSLSTAEEKTTMAREAQREIEDILLHALELDDSFNWDTLKDEEPFNLPNPKNQLQAELNSIKQPAQPPLKKIPEKPNESEFAPIFTLIDKLFPAIRQKKVVKSETSFHAAVQHWERIVIETEKYNKNQQDDYKRKLNDYNEKKHGIRSRFDTLEDNWKKQEEGYYQQQKERNSKIDYLKDQYFKCERSGVVEYCEQVLNNSIYPEQFPRDFEIDFNEDTRILVVEYMLPAPVHLPTLTEVKYIATKRELKETHLSETQVAKVYDSTIYKIALRTLHELFEADQANALEAIVFNGWVEAVNKATGKLVKSCIVSLQTMKSEFLEIQLSHVDPKTCFKNLKGIGSSKLSGLVAIRPIAEINRNDRRFVDSYSVTEKMSEGDNLATMDWEDFEHLIRELFAKEFTMNGAEVKVTQASRDGGVDAIAFDPDPIRGGKLVIQAKRYTNTVGVSAVRDLYGTVLNEGANKGILVTTADYGPDAYEFAKNKPLSLMNGGNLLHLLEKHGHKARIDVAEAKRQMKSGV